MYIVAGIIVVIVVFLSVGYVKSPPNTATIISGPGKHPRVLIGKAGFKIPFLERVDRMGIGQIDIDIETEDYIPTKDFINIQVDAIAQVAVDTSPKNIEIAKVK
jgi:flotillin